MTNDNGVRLVHFATSENLTDESTMLPHCNIQKYSWVSPGGKTHNHIDHISADGQRHSSILDVKSFRAADCDTGNYLAVEKGRRDQHE
jgi:hypothetical protein